MPFAGLIRDFKIEVSRRTLAVGVCGCIALIAPALVGRTAYAQAQIAAGAPGGLTGLGGVRVGEGVFLRVGVSAEAGYDSNIFYNDARKKDASTIQVTPHAEISNQERSGEAPPLRYLLGASLLCREYLSDETEIKDQRAFNPALQASLRYGGAGTLGFGLSDQFMRLEEAPYNLGQDPIKRVFNNFGADLHITPGGGRLQNTVRYSNSLELFENNDASFANRIGQDLALTASWKWLPKTAVYVEVGGGYIHYLNPNPDSGPTPPLTKVDSIPYRALLGLRGLVTPKVTVNLGAGYADAYYKSDRPTPSGWGQLLGLASLNYNPITFTNVILSYEHKFVDSPFIGNFYDDDEATLGLSQQLGAFILRGSYNYAYRRYHGFAGTSTTVLETRKDHLQRATVDADYYLQRWFYAGFSYKAFLNRATDVLVISPFAADYTKHVILGRLGITY